MYIYINIVPYTHIFKMWEPTLKELQISGKVGDDGQIYNRAFAEDTILKKLRLPEGIKKILDDTFIGCINMEEIQLPTTCTLIGSYVFRNCYSLHTVLFPKNLTIIQRGAFFNCTSLTTIELPDTLVIMEGLAFWSCTNLTTISFPETMTLLGAHAFSKCVSLQKVILPTFLTTIEQYAFYCCKKITEIKFPDNLVRIGTYAFYKCAGLQQIVLPESLVNVDDFAFNGCCMLNDIAIYDNPKTIGNSVFNGCDHLSTIFIIPSSTTRVVVTTHDLTIWNNIMSIHFPHVIRIWASDAIIATLDGPLDGPFNDCTRYDDLPLALQAAPSRIKSWDGIQLWQYWTSPDVACGVEHFKLQSMQYRQMVWNILLVFERYSKPSDEDKEIESYSDVSIDVCMLIFEFCRRDVPDRYKLE